MQQRVRTLRARGKTYAEICELLGEDIPKSTLNYWCRDVQLTSAQSRRILEISQANLVRARRKAVASNKAKREAYLYRLLEQNKVLAQKLYDKSTGKIALAMLYWGEGSSDWRKDSLYFGNSNPRLIATYLWLLRRCYALDESKFRCTVQCRADQDTDALQRFWMKITSIPARQFYKPQVDKRTIGKPTKKPRYMGVCRIDYLSAHLFTDIMQAIKVIQEGR